MQSPEFTTAQFETLVFGNHWSAVFATARAALAGQRVLWIRSTSVRILAPMPQLNPTKGGKLWFELFENYGLLENEPKDGIFLRDYRNKAFQIPAWVSNPSLNEKEEIQKEILWAPEREFMGFYEIGSPQTSFGELYDQLSAKIHELPNVHIIESQVLTEAHYTDEGLEVGAASGDRWVVNRLIFCDEFNEAKKTDGIKENLKKLDYTREMNRSGAIQIEFVHQDPITLKPGNGFFTSTVRDSGDSIQRNVFGYFLNNGERSRWTFLLTPEEQEDNQIIARKIRRMKQALNKMFTGAEWLGAHAKEFTDTIERETVRLEENAVFWSESQEKEEKKAIEVLPSIYIALDKFGPEISARQINEIVPDSDGPELSLGSPEVDTQDTTL